MPASGRRTSDRMPRATGSRRRARRSRPSSLMPRAHGARRPLRGSRRLDARRAPGSAPAWPPSRESSPTISPSATTRMRSLMLRTSGSSDEMRMMPMPSCASSSMRAWTSALAPTSMPRVGSSRMSTLGLSASHLASATFCWLPPDRRLTGDVEQRRPNRTAGHGTTRPPRVTAARSTSPAARHPVHDAHRDVVADRHVQEQALALAVLGDVADAQAGRRPAASGW